MSRSVWRYEVPVDDRVHLVPFVGRPLHVSARRVDVVEFWAEVHAGAPPRLPRRLQVFGTGQALPEGARWLGTCLAGDAAVLVWHLYEVSA